MGKLPTHLVTILVVGFLCTSTKKQRKIETTATIKMPHLQQENRERALGMLDKGTSRRPLAAKSGVHLSTINHLATGSTKDRPRCGHKRVTTAN